MEDRLIAVATFKQDAEANVAAAWLEDEGVSAQVLDGYAFGADPYNASVVGRVKVVVPQSQEARAQELMADYWAQRQARLEQAESQCPNCGSANIRMDRSRGLLPFVLAVLTLGIGWFAFDKQRVCKDCGGRW